MVVGSVVSCERDDRVGQWILSAGFAHGAEGERRRDENPWTLKEVRAAVKSSRGGCCAIANGSFGGEIASESASTLFRCAWMPVGVRKMSPAIPLTAALARLLSALVAGFIHARYCLAELFFGFCGCCVHRILHGTKDVAAGRTLADAFHYANFVHAAASNIHPPVGRCRHIANHAATRRNGGARELVRLRTIQNDRVGLYSRSAVPDHSIRRNRE